ncbi:hypothetical protein J6590_065007 [Homalodisca vitripennis]|nr:hypothetical protein J6590_065007 [Homalodisca vitripennis]
MTFLAARKPISPLDTGSLAVVIVAWSRLSVCWRRDGGKNALIRGVKVEIAVGRCRSEAKGERAAMIGRRCEPFKYCVGRALY